MAPSSRPAQRTARERPARQTKSPPPTTDQNTNRDSTAPTRRSAQGGPRSANHEQLETSPGSLIETANELGARNPRKRSASLVDADTSVDLRPPTKVTVTQPHGELLRITNGVAAPLSIAIEEVPSGVATPAADAPGASLAAPTPSPAGQTQDKRCLRSKDGGSRVKSQLATYFPNYDEIIAGAPQPADFVDVDTPIYLVDEPPRPSKRQRTASPELSQKPSTPSRTRKAGANTPTRSIVKAPVPAAQSSTAYQVLDYASVARHLRNDDTADPLPDSRYLVQHRRAERKEKQLRNIEKDRAMHEKQQLDDLVEGLKGHDWLKVMGITGVTDGDRKHWEPKRQYFLKEVEALVDKFRIWKEEEKRLRAEKESLHAAHKDEEEGTSTESDAASSSAEHAATGTEPAKHHAPKDTHKPATGKKPAEPNAQPTPQPQQPRRPPRPHGFFLPVPPAEPLGPFTSFYAKPHLRAAALGKHRHGRYATAFGHPIPDFAECEFALPGEYVTADALRAHDRERRRRKREKAERGASK